MLASPGLRQGCPNSSGRIDTLDISSNGRYVAFDSNATDLIGVFGCPPQDPNCTCFQCLEDCDANNQVDVFVYDLRARQITLVSVASNGDQGNGRSTDPAISADGRYVVFTSRATNLVPGDTNNLEDIFAHDLLSGQTTRVSLASDGAQANRDCFGPAISGNGRYVAFSNMSGLLVPGDTNMLRDVFLSRPAGVGMNLSVAEFGLDPAAITFAAGRYTLPVQVTVLNTAELTATNVVVRFQDNSGWSDTRTIPEFPPGELVYPLELDITAALLPGQGAGSVQLTASIDPQSAIGELDESDNLQSASVYIDARPRLLEVKPEYTLAGSYFLDNQSVPNPIQVMVDWNGELPGGGTAPYGDVYFDLNGVQTRVSGQDWGAQHTYDMGADFAAAFSCANNTLRIWAALPVQGGELRSLEHVVQPTVFAWPGWVSWLETFGLGAFDTMPNAPLVEYSYANLYPEEPFEAAWTPPGWVPYLGGEELGIRATQAGLRAVGRSNGSGRLNLTGQTGFDLAAFSVDGSASGAGDVQFVCAESLDLTRAEWGLDINATVNKEMGLLDLTPAVKAAEKWPVVGRIIRWVNSVAQVEGALSPGVAIDTVFAEQAGQLKFVQGTDTGYVRACATLSTEPCAGLPALHPRWTLPLPPAWKLPPAPGMEPRGARPSRLQTTV